LVGADLHPLGQALANCLDCADAKAAANIPGAAAAFGDLDRFARLDFCHKPQPRLLIRHPANPFLLKRANDPEADATLQAGVPWRNTVPVRRAANRWVVRP